MCVPLDVVQPGWISAWTTSSSDWASPAPDPMSTSATTHKKCLNFDSTLGTYWEPPTSKVTFGRGNLVATPATLAPRRVTRHASVMTEDDTLDLTGKLLIAMPGIGDPRFDRSVVYICAHSDDGALGLVVNREVDEVSQNDLFSQLDIDVAPRIATRT